MCVQPIVDRAAQVLRLKCGPRRFVPGSRDVRVTPLTYQAVESLPHRGRTDCTSPWLQDRLARLRLYPSGAAVNIDWVELQILEHDPHCLFFLSFAMARPFHQRISRRVSCTVPCLDNSSAAVYLIKRRPRILPTFPSSLSSAHPASTSGAAAIAMTNTVG